MVEYDGTFTDSLARAVTERRILQLLGILSLYGCVALPAKGQKTAFVSLKQLASEHRWLELRDEASHQKSTFYQAMAAAVFNEPDAERLFLEVIRQRPTSEDAYESFDWLSNIYLKSGRYRSLVDIMEARWAEFPDKKGVVSEKSELAPFRGLPNQENGPRRKSVLRHSPDSLAVMLSINDKSAKF